MAEVEDICLDRTQLVKDYLTYFTEFVADHFSKQFSILPPI